MAKNSAQLKRCHMQGMNALERRFNCLCLIPATRAISWASSRGNPNPGHQDPEEWESWVQISPHAKFLS